MASTELENLVKIGKLKTEPPAVQEIEGLLQATHEVLTALEAPMSPQG